MDYLFFSPLNRLFFTSQRHKSFSRSLFLGTTHCYAMQDGKHTFYMPYNRQKPRHTLAYCFFFLLSMLSPVLAFSIVRTSECGGKIKAPPDPYLKVHLFSFQFSLLPLPALVFLDRAEDKKKKAFFHRPDQFVMCRSRDVEKPCAVL